MDDLRLVCEYLDSIGAYYNVHDTWRTDDGNYFLIFEDISGTSHYVLRVKDGVIYNHRNEVVG